MVNLYRISARGLPVAFVRQKRMAIKEDIRFFADEDETDELFRIKARSMMEIGGRYDVTTPAGERIGVLGKVFGKSLLRSTWRILGADEQELAVAQERSMLVAIARRVADSGPVRRVRPDPLPLPDRPPASSSWASLHAADAACATATTLDLSGDPERTIDRRLAIALGVALDALQSR